MNDTVQGIGDCVARLGQIAEVRSGYQTRNRIERDASSPFRIIQLRDVGERADWQSLVTFKPDIDTARYLVADGDVLLSCRGGAPVGVALSGVPENTVASSNFYVLRLRLKDVLPEYLAWHINQLPAQQYFSVRSQGTRIALLTKADVVELEVPIPPHAVQRRLVDLANLRRTERDLLRRLETQKDFLIQSLCQSAIHRATHTEA